ncbi:MAG: argininosuccinate lyase [Candidatus Omnitrophica bacterium]|nr:argininosuccinate lyase [Candidatus Omnitrophota bacterium]
MKNKKLWGGRFSKKTNPLVEEFTKSVQYDYNLAAYDVLGSVSHVAILKKAGYLTANEAKKLTSTLNSILNDIKKNKFKPDLSCEDIHTDIQNILYKKAGNLALKLHTARSRNDQVAFSTKLYCKDALADLQNEILILATNIAQTALKNKKIIIPGFTHLQHAQPVYLKDYLLAYVEMLKRDDKRLGYISENIKLVMDAGALAGTPVHSKEYNTANTKPVENSLDTVSDRDFVIEAISALSIVAMHLSRLAEDLVIWSTKEFDFIEIDESFCTGSSLMPQKKNPDVLELIRGYAGRLYGNLVSVLTMMKGLPLTYNRDMQLDKEPLFNSFEIVSSELKVLTGLMKTLKFNTDKIAEHLEDESLYVTDMVYYLVNKKVPFKEAHTIIGKLVKESADSGVDIKKMKQAKLNEFSDKLVEKEIKDMFDPKKSVESKRSIKR